MKKIIALIATIVFATSLGLFIGCSSDDAFRVDVFVYSDEDEYGQVLSTKITDTLKKEYGFKVERHNGDSFSDSTQQMNQIRDVLARGTDLLIVALVTYSDGDEVARLAKDAGIQVIFYIREPYDNNNDTIKNNDNTIFMGVNNTNAGTLQGQIIADYLTNSEDFAVADGTVVNYIVYRGDIGNPAADDRTAAVVAEANRILNDRGVTLNSLVKTPSGGTTYDGYDTQWWDEAAYNHLADWISENGGTESVAKATIGDNGKLNLIMSNSDAMTIRAIDALEATGHNVGDLNKSILTIGMDAGTPGVKYIEQKRMAATLYLDSEFNTRLIVKAAFNISEGKKGAAAVENIGDDETEEVIISKDPAYGGRLVEFNYVEYEGNL